MTAALDAPFSFKQSLQGARHERTFPRDRLVELFLHHDLRIGSEKDRRSASVWRDHYRDAEISDVQWRS